MATRQYLSPWEAACQAWLNSYTLFFVLAILKVSFFSKTFVHLIQAAKTPTIALCQQLQNVSAQQSRAPEFYSAMTSAAVRALFENTAVATSFLLRCILKVAIAIVGFLIELYLGTVTCLCTAAVKGTLEFVTSISKEITESVQNAVSKVVSGLNSAISGLRSVFSDLEKVLNTIKSWFKDTSNNVSSVSSAIDGVDSAIKPLTAISIPTGYIDDLKSLESRVPDFDDVLDDLTSLVTSPLSYVENYLQNQQIELVLPDFNSTFSNTTSNKQISVSYASLPSNCDVIGSDLDLASDAINSMAKYTIIGLIMTTVLAALVGMTFTAFKRLRYQHLLSDLTKEPDLVVAGNLIHAYDLGILGHLTKDFHGHLSWFFGFVFTSHLNQCLALGLMSWVVVLAEYVIYRKGRHLLAEAALAPQNSDLKSKLVSEYSGFLNETQYALEESVDVLNSELFGQIHNLTSEMLQVTTDFQDVVNNTISSALGSSFLSKPLQTIIYCTIGRKVDKIQDGLEWMLEHTVISTPDLNQTEMTDIFSRSVSDTGGLENMYTHLHSALQRITDECAKSIKQDLYVAAGVSGVWICFLLLGMVIALSRNFLPARSSVPHQTIGWPIELTKEIESRYEYPFSNPYAK